MAVGMPGEYFQIHLHETSPGHWDFTLFRCEDGGVMERAQVKDSLAGGLDQAGDFVREPAGSIGARVARLRRERSVLMGGSPL